MPFDTDCRPIDHTACAAERLAGIDRLLAEAAPGRIRHRPVRRAVWRILLLPADDVLSMYCRQLRSIASDPDTSNHLITDPDALQALAVVMVAKAILGDIRAARFVSDLIEGRPRRHRPIRHDDGGMPQADIERLVGLMYQHAGVS